MKAAIITAVPAAELDTTSATVSPSSSYPTNQTTSSGMLASDTGIYWIFSEGSPTYAVVLICLAYVIFISTSTISHILLVSMFKTKRKRRHTNANLVLMISWAVFFKSIHEYLRCMSFQLFRFDIDAQNKYVCKTIAVLDGACVSLMGLGYLAISLFRFNIMYRFRVTANSRRSARNKTSVLLLVICAAAGFAVCNNSTTILVRCSQSNVSRQICTSSIMIDYVPLREKLPIIILNSAYLICILCSLVLTGVVTHASIQRMQTTGRRSNTLGRRSFSAKIQVGMVALLHAMYLPYFILNILLSAKVIRPSFSIDALRYALISLSCLFHNMLIQMSTFTSSDYRRYLRKILKKWPINIASY